MDETNSSTNTSRIGQGFLELAVVGENKQYTRTPTQDGRLIS